MGLKKSLRQAFGESLISLAEKYKNFIVLDADVAGGTHTKDFSLKYPHRFIQCGIAEQNMAAVAAGLSTTGFIPIITTYGIFASLRIAEVLRNMISYGNFNVKVAASHLGLDTGPDGATHQVLEDISLIRTFPNFKIIAPSDPSTMEHFVELMLIDKGPVFLRTGRSPLSTIKHKKKLPIGKAEILKKGSDITLAAYGVMVNRIIKASEILEKNGISTEVINIPTLKPFDVETVLESYKKTGIILSCEDHTIYGGLGSIISEELSEQIAVKVFKLGIKDKFGASGDPEKLAEIYKIDVFSIVEKVKNIMKKTGGLNVKNK